MLRGLAALPPARRRLVVATVALVVAAITAAIVAAIVTVVGRSAAPRPVAQTGSPPVLLVPGYGGSTAGLNDLARVLRAHGRDATVFSLPGDGRGDLDQQADALSSTVTAVRARTGAPTVDVVGYSAGGVVARLWVRDHGGSAQARRVVSLGSPQHGTDLATLAGSALPGACPIACRQLASGSALLTHLDSGDETPPGPTWVSIWTTADDVVLPPDSARLVGALDFSVQDVCPGDTVRHTGLPTDSRVQAMVLAVLQGRRPQRPTSCATVS